MRGFNGLFSRLFLKEQSGEGAEHRRLILQKYKNYATSGVGKDFPISKFTGRHSGATEAIGYGKTAMFFTCFVVKLGIKFSLTLCGNFIGNISLSPLLLMILNRFLVR